MYKVQIMYSILEFKAYLTQGRDAELQAGQTFCF
jgi:hypothetical protein